MEILESLNGNVIQLVNNCMESDHNRNVYGKTKRVLNEEREKIYNWNCVICTCDRIVHLNHDTSILLLFKSRHFKHRVNDLPAQSVSLMPT